MPITPAEVEIFEVTLASVKQTLAKNPAFESWPWFEIEILDHKAPRARLRCQNEKAGQIIVLYAQKLSGIEFDFRLHRM